MLFIRGPLAFAVVVSMTVSLYVFYFLSFLLYVYFIQPHLIVLAKLLKKQNQLILLAGFIRHLTIFSVGFSSDVSILDILK